MKDIQIRPAIEADLPDLLGLIRAIAQFDGCLDSVKVDVETLRAAFFSDRPKANALVAVIGGKAVGMATYYPIFSSFIGKPGIWLDDLYICEEYRRHGIGRALMTKLCEIAYHTGCVRIDWIVAQDNANGLGFYKRLGAQIFETVRQARLDEAAIAGVYVGLHNKPLP